MRYEGTVYRPPSEAGSLIIQATLACPHNKCAFCGMYKGRRFRARPVPEVIEDLDIALDVLGPLGVRTIFLADGNTAVLPTEKLVAIAEAARARFPALERITMYGSAKFLVKKSLEQWRAVAAAGITRIHSGLESGDAATLRAINKGVTPEGAVEAYRHVMAAGIELSVYLMVGVAGVEGWREHALGSARVLNQAPPTFIRLRTFVPQPGTPWHDRWREGALTLPSAQVSVSEARSGGSRRQPPAERISAAGWYTPTVGSDGRSPATREEVVPLYEYWCQTCESRFEVLQRVGAGSDGLACPTCGALQVTRQFSTFAAATGVGAGGAGGASCAPSGRFT
jgi:putative FmdB family regulatory protein